MSGTKDKNEGKQAQSAGKGKAGQTAGKGNSDTERKSQNAKGPSKGGSKGTRG